MVWACGEKGDDDWVKKCTRLEVVVKIPRKPKENVDDNVESRYEKRCSVPGGCKGQMFMEEDPWCKTANLG
jgi:hypothetical protein